MATPSVQTAPATRSTEAQESCFFFPGPEGSFLYGCADLPADSAGVGVVMAAPLGRERHRAYREMLVLARALAAAGYPVLRFDYRGEGESAGAFSTSTIASRVEDTVAAVHELRARAGVHQVCLAGFHVGAVVALMAAPRAEVGQLVLCDPVTNVKVFARGLVRSNVVLQNQYFGEVRQGEEALRATLAQGGTISMYGYPLGLPLLQELEALDPAPHLAAFRGRSAIVPFSQIEAPPKKDVVAWKEQLDHNGTCAITPAVLPGFGWGSRVTWGHELPAVKAALLSFLAGAPPRTGAPARLAPRPRLEVTGREVLELRNHQGARMSGILTSPPADKARRATVVILQAGLLNKTGVGDYFRWLADALALEGYHVLRVDQTGTGDSEGEIVRDVPIDAYFRKIQAGAAKDDLLDQIRWVGKTLGHREIHLLGQCGGCVSALLACAEVPDDVASLVCIAMPVLYSEGIETIREGDAAAAGRGYFRKLTSWDSYRRLLGGESDYRLIKASVLAAAKRVRKQALERVDAKLHVTDLMKRFGLHVAPDHPRFNTHVWEAFQAVMKAQGKVLFLMAELDNETPEFNDEFKAKVLDRSPTYSRLCTIQTLARADHSLMFQESRDDSLGRILAWLCG